MRSVSNRALRLLGLSRARTRRSKHDRPKGPLRPSRTQSDYLALGGGALAFARAEFQTSRSGGYYYMVAVADLACQQFPAQRGFQLALDHPAQRPGAVDRIVAMLGKVVARLIRQFQFDLALLQPLAEPHQ